MNKPARIIAYTITALLVVAIGGIIFVARPFARSSRAPALPDTQHIAAPSSPVVAPIIVPPPATPTVATTSPDMRSFSGLVSSIWDDRIIIESRTSLATGAVAPHTIIITPDTRIRGGTSDDINVGTNISGSGTNDSNGAIIADSLAINPPFQR